LPEIEFTINNTINSFTDKSLMQFLASLDALSALEVTALLRNSAMEWALVRDELHDEVRHVLVFAQAKMFI
jgi:hypothetical protein